MRAAVVIAGVLIVGVLPAMMCRAENVVDRDYVSIVGVPQVLKYADSVSNALTQTTHQKYALVENMTAGTGIRLFCGGLGRNKPDLYLLSSSSPNVNTAACSANGVNRVLKLPLGHDALAASVAPGQKPFNLSRRTLYLALAARVPSTDAAFAGTGNPLGTTFVPNRFKRWNQIDPSLPDMPIRILAPAAQSIDWWSINDIIMRDGCNAVKPVAAMARVALQTYGALCYNRRTDDAIVYANDQEYWNNPALQPTGPADVAVGPYRLLAKAPDSVPLPLEGITPSDPTIADGTYPGSRMVTLFVKTEKYNIVPGLQQFVIEMTSPEAIGPGGYLTKRGLVPLPDVQLREVGVAARFSTQ